MDKLKAVGLWIVSIVIWILGIIPWIIGCIVGIAIMAFVSGIDVIVRRLLK